MNNPKRTIEGRGSTVLTCKACGTSFVRPNAHVRGRTNACSIACSHKVKPRRSRTLINCFCKECGTSFQIRKGKGGTGEYCSTTCRAIAVGRKKRGENHPNWNDGSSERNYASRKAIAQMIKERGTCEVCGSVDDLQGHHIKLHSAEPALRADPANIQVLCRACHAGKHPKLSAFILAGRMYS